MKRAILVLLILAALRWFLRQHSTPERRLPNVEPESADWGGWACDDCHRTDGTHDWAMEH